MNRFPTTQWTLVERVGREAPLGSKEQMGQLLAAYREPMLLHLRFKGQSEEQAEDVLQDFIIELLNKNLISIADPNKGKFRTLLLTMLDRFLVSKHRYDSAAKRSPGSISSLDAHEHDQTEQAGVDPSTIFERSWAIDVLAQALNRMKAECEAQGHDLRWAIFDRRLLLPLLHDVDPPEYAELATEFGLQGEKAAMNQLVTAKRQFARSLREVVQEYVTRMGDPDEQIQNAAETMLREGKHNDDRHTAVRFATHLTHQSIQSAVEEEIEQLQKILASSRGIADQVPALQRLSAGNPVKTDDVKSSIMARLEQPSPEGHLSGIFAWGTETIDQSPESGDAYFEALLNADLGEFIGKPLQGTSLREALDENPPNLETLEQIKEWTNICRASRNKTLHGDLASGLFYLVLALALVHHDKKITGLHDRAMTSGFEWLAEQPWLPESYRGLLEDACKSLGS